jgi:hypothetical protein
LHYKRPLAFGPGVLFFFGAHQTNMVIGIWEG